MEPFNKKIDVATLGAANQDSWSSSKLASIGTANLRYRVMRDRSTRFHTHENAVECFFVLSGQLNIDTRQTTIELHPGEFLELKPGTEHRARVEGEATFLMFDSIDH